jgi:hypothetical protein
MAGIPTVPGTEQVSTPTTGIRLDANTLEEPARAQMGLAGTIGDAGQELAAFGQKIQGVVNYGIRADADRQMRQASADFQASRAGRTDEGDWENQWKQKSAETQAAIYDQHNVGPMLRRQLDVDFKNWDQANAIEVRTIARKQMINRAVERADMDANMAAKDGDEQGVITAIKGRNYNGKSLTDLGALFPEQAEQLVKKNLAAMDHYAAAHLITNDPITAEQALAEEDKNGKPVNFKRITPENRLTLQFEAHRLATQAKAGTAADFFNRKQAFLTGEGPDIPPAEVRQAAVQGRLTPAQAKQFLKPPKPDFDPGKFAALTNDIANYDPNKDTDKSGYAALVARAAYDPDIKGPAASDAMEMLKKKADPKSLFNSPEAKAGNELINENFKRGIYGSISKLTQAPDGSWKMKTDPKGLAQAQTMRAQAQTALDGWLAKPENSKATPAAVQHFISTFNRTARTNALFAPAINTQTAKSAVEGTWVEPDRED